MITRSELFIILCILLIVYILYKNHYTKEKYTIGDVTFKWKKEKDIPEPKTNVVPNVIHLPKRKKPKRENIPFF